MYPIIIGSGRNAFSLSYTLCMILGIILAILYAAFYFKKQGIKKDGVIDLLICACFAIAGGIIFSILFENLYELIEKGPEYEWTWGMTFLGGLFGGVVGFLTTYFVMKENINFKLGDVLKVAPVSIALAHSIGRVGCTLAGCCYGKHTDSWIGVEFPGIGKVIPTQLIEAIFLFILFVVMWRLLARKSFKYNLVIYMFSYSIFRFIIEFYRGDERGVAFFLSPSQVWSIILFIGAIPTMFLLKKIYEKE